MTRRFGARVAILYSIVILGYAIALLWTRPPAQPAEPTAWVNDAVEKIQADRTALDLRAAKLCREIHGEAGYTWAEDGRLVCLPRKGGRS